MTVTLKADARTLGESVENIRKAGKIPAVFYGAKASSTAITVNDKEFLKVLHEAGESTAISLKTPTETLDVMIHDIQFDPVKNKPLHVDFLVIDMNKPITVKVPIEFTGIALAVKNSLGNLVEVLHEIEIEALPKNLPHSLPIDVSILAEVDQKLQISDIAVPAGVTILDNPEEIVALIAPFVEEKEEVEPIDLSVIEVEKKGKKDDDTPLAEAETPVA